MLNTADETASPDILANCSLPTSETAGEASPAKPATRSAKKKRQAQPEHLRAVPLSEGQSSEHSASRLESSAATPAALPSLNQKVSKTDVVISFLQRETGATLPEMMTATQWQAHSVRGFLSGTVRKKLGLNLCSEVSNDGVRRYRIRPLGDSTGSPDADASAIIDLPPFGPFRGAQQTGASTAETVG